MGIGFLMMPLSEQHSREDAARRRVEPNPGGHSCIPPPSSEGFRSYSGIEFRAPGFRFRAVGL